MCILPLAAAVKSTLAAGAESRFVAAFLLAPLASPMRYTKQIHSLHDTPARE